ncbi:MAG: DNA hydrolase [Acidobacteria bacterium]|nr:MAG: DNA hydrolase [Acidobacteriota bacterium]
MIEESEVEEDEASAATEDLLDYEPADYPPVAVTVDVVILTIEDKALKVLLVRRAQPPFEGMWALPGGFVRPDETLDEAALRELGEETGLEPAAPIEQLRSYGDPGRDPRMRVITVAYVAVLKSVSGLRAGSDAAEARLVEVASLLGETGEPPAFQLAFDHEEIVADAVELLRARLESTLFASAFVGAEFTLAELRGVYEAVWGVELDPANFRRKVLGVQNYLIPTGSRVPPGPEGGRPAELYRVNQSVVEFAPVIRRTLA